MPRSSRPLPSEEGGGLGGLRRDIRRVATAKRANANTWFFKTGPGEYGAGDKFLGVTLPEIRALSRRCDHLPLVSIRRLIRSPWHEERLLAVIILTRQYARADRAGRDAIYRFYLRHTRWINNWDLVDVSAPRIVGEHLLDRDRAVLRRLARSRLLWERRIAIIATMRFIAAGDVRDTLAIAGLLVKDPHDLIHKAVGWMLREAGKRNRAAEERFLRRHAAAMPRTMLRYAIEKFPEPLRQKYLRAASHLKASPHVKASSQRHRDTK